MGFTTYITPAPAPQPTLLERIAALSSSQKTAILNGYAADTKPLVLKHEIGISQQLIVAINTEITNIRKLTKAIIREEILITEGAYDEEGNEITAPVFNDAPTSINDLKDEVAANFTDIFTSGQVGAVIDKMIEWSEVDASGNPIGTAAVWSVEVVK